MRIGLNAGAAISAAALAALIMWNDGPSDVDHAARQWMHQATKLAARAFEDASLYLNTTTLLRRDRLASIEMVADYPEGHPLRKLAKAVGMLLIAMEKPDGTRRSYACTGALIRGDVVITNQHCLRKDGGTSVEVMFWLDHTDHDDGTVLMLEPSPTEIDATLDYALLKPHAPSGTGLRSNLDVLPVRDAVPGERLFIIHHSKGKPQQISRAFCRAAGERALPDEINHTCPTHRGSSGALVFAESDGAIVGLHHSATTRADTVRGYATALTAIFAKSQVLSSRRRHTE